MTEQSVNPGDVQAPPAPQTAPEPAQSSLDPDRKWFRIHCANGHELVVEAHEGGSRAHCDQCGVWVDYAGYTHTPVEDALKAAALAEARALVAAADAGEAPTPADHQVVAGDSAVSTSGSGTPLTT